MLKPTTEDSKYENEYITQQKVVVLQINQKLDYQAFNYYQLAK